MGDISVWSSLKLAVDRYSEWRQLALVQPVYDLVWANLQ